MGRYPAIAAGAAVLAAAMSGCGGLPPIAAAPHFSEAQAAARVRGVIVRFSAAIAVGDGTSACSLLDEAAQQQIAGPVGGPTPGQSVQVVCQHAIVTFAAKLDRGERQVLQSVHVGKVLVQGEMASVDARQITSPYGSGPPSLQAGQGMSLIAHNGGWLIDAGG